MVAFTPYTHRLNMIVERDFCRFISPVFFLFQLFGLFPIDITSTRKYKIKSLIWLYSFSLAIGTGITGIFFFRNRIKMCNVYVNVAVDQTMLLSALLAHVVVCCEVFGTIPKHVDLCQRFQMVLKVFHKRLAFSVNLDSMRRQSVFRSWTSFLAIVFSITLSVMLMNESARMEFQWIFLSGCVTQLRLIQFTMYVQFVNDLLGQLKLELVRIAAADSGCKKRCTALRECMDIYSMISEIVQILNAIFGWSLIAILIHNLCAITNSSYWTVYNLYYMQRNRLNFCEYTRSKN